MQLFHAVLFGIILSVDSFSAAFAMGFRSHTVGDAFKYCAISAISAGGMAVLGFFFGHIIISKISAYDHWIAFFLLIVVGLHMIFEAIRKIRQSKTKAKKTKEPENFYGALRILLVSFITSLDALGVGMGLGVAGKSWLLYSFVIGMGALMATFVGLRLARVFSENFGPRCEIVGGLVLIILAFPMLNL